MTIGFPETEGICNFGPRFHKGKCKKTHFELGHGIPFPATGIAKKIIFQSLKNCFRTRRSCNVSQGQCNKKQFFRSRKIVLSQSSMSFHQGPVNTEKRQKKTILGNLMIFFVTEQKPVCISLFRPAGGPPLKIWFPGLPCGRGPNRLNVRASAYSL